MQIKVQYNTQVKAAAGASGCVVQVRDQANIEDVVREAAEKGSQELRQMLLDDDGGLQTTLLLFVGDECVSRREPRPLQDGETVTIMSPISGG